MNAYSVVSEQLEAKVPILEVLPGCWEGPTEPYAIAHVVIAETRSKAKWMAWQTDKDSGRDPRDMPKFSARKLKAAVEGPPRIATDEPEYRRLWEEADARDPVALKEEVAELRKELEAVLGVVVQPWTREDGTQLWKVNLAWLETAESQEEALMLVARLAGLPAHTLVLEVAR